MVLWFAINSSLRTLHTIYFPNCRRTLRSYFFARKLMKFINEKSCVIMENWNQTLWKTFKDNSQPKKFRKTETKLCGNLQRQFSDFSNLKTIFSPKLCGKLKTEPNFVDKRCVDFFKFVKIQHCIQQRFKNMASVGKIRNGTGG